MWTAAINDLFEFVVGTVAAVQYFNITYQSNPYVVLYLNTYCTYE